MEAKHTPGPMVAVGERVYYRLDDEYNGALAATCEDADTAQFFAAAPDMYEALVRLVNVADTAASREHDRTERAMFKNDARVARAAIAKAEGR